MNIRKAIRLALVKKDRNQTWLAEQLGVKRQTVSRWLRGNSSITIKRLESVGVALDLTLAELIDLGED